MYLLSVWVNMWVGDGAANPQTFPGGRKECQARNASGWRQFVFAGHQSGRRLISRSWIFRYTLNDRTRHMGLGSLQSVSLSEAREAAAQARRQLELGADPIDARDASRAAAAAANAKQISFDECASAYVAAHRAGWRNVEHARQWKRRWRPMRLPLLAGFPFAISIPVSFSRS